jgi:hypothetical protein
MYKELLGLNQIVDAEYILNLIKDVDKELTDALSFYLEKKSCDFSISNIISEQKTYLKLFKGED